MVPNMKNPSDLPGGNVPRWTLGDRLRKARTNAGIERDEMAEDIGVTDRTISNYELDSTRAPKLVIKEYALRTGVPYEWLMDGDFPPEGVRVPTTPGYSEVSDLMWAA